MADERSTPLNQGVDKWLQITEGGKLQTWNGVDAPTPIIGDDPLVTKTELDDKASLSLNHGYVSEYTSRVMQEGGTIQNGRRTAAPFISPTYEDAKMLLNASGGLDIAEVDGRKVVNKIWDSSQEKDNQLFAGSDRPEFTDYNGFESVDVEKESENVALHSNSFLEAYWEKFRVNVLLSQIESPVGPSYELNEDDSDDSHRLGQSASNRDGVYRFSVFLKAKERRYVQISHINSSSYQDNTRYANFDLISGDVTFNSTNAKGKIYPQRNGWFRCSFEYNVNDLVSARCFVTIIKGPLSPRSESYQGVNGEGVYISGAQDEKSTYDTNYILTEGSPVTRLAPVTEIKDAMPETGTVAGVVDRIAESGSSPLRCIVFGSNTTDTSNKECLFRFGTNNINEFTLIIYGTTGGFFGTENVGWSLTQSDRVVHAHAVTWDNETLDVWFLHEGSIYKHSTSHTINDSSVKDIILGGRSGATERQQSNRFEKTWYKDNIVRVNETDEEIKQFFEDLTRGTSMATKAENMTIVE